MNNSRVNNLRVNNLRIRSQKVKISINGQKKVFRKWREVLELLSSGIISMENSRSKWSLLKE